MLERLLEIAPNAQITTVSFRELPWEPPFLDDIRELAAAKRAQFFESTRLNEQRIGDFLHAHPIDLLLTVNWRYRVPTRIYQAAPLGSFVFHDSLLPAYRGFSPTVWAITNGETETGVTLFEMTDEIDAGDIVGQAVVPIGPDETIGTVLNRVTDAYLRLLDEHLPGLLAGSAPRRAQDQAAATFVCKRAPSDYAIDWAWPAERIHNLIRATTTPYPGAFTTLEGRILRIWASERLEHGPRFVSRASGRIGEIRPDGTVVVLTGAGELLITRVQLEDHAAQPPAEVLNRLDVTLGH